MAAAPTAPYCAYHLRGSCARGAACRFSHAPIPAGAEAAAAMCAPLCTFFASPQVHTTADDVILYWRLLGRVFGVLSASWLLLAQEDP
eukprot:3025850-Pyramimonas_sp.AAC.1